MGLGLGLISLGFPQAYGFGWGHIQKALDGEQLIMTMAAVGVAKILATSMTIGSGGSRGAFGPTLFIGGILGGAVGYGGHELQPVFFSDPGADILVGMAAFFAGVASAPIGAMLIVAEITGSYTSLPSSCPSRWSPPFWCARRRTTRIRSETASNPPPILATSP